MSVIDLFFIVFFFFFSSRRRHTRCGRDWSSDVCSSDLDVGISGETSDLFVQPACIGRIWFQIDVQGKPAGIQQRYQGISAIELGNKIVSAVQELEDERVATVKHALYPSAIDSLPCIIGSFQAGNYPSAFPASAVL